MYYLEVKESSPLRISRPSSIKICHEILDFTSLFIGTGRLTLPDLFSRKLCLGNLSGVVPKGDQYCIILLFCRIKAKEKGSISNVRSATAHLMPGPTEAASKPSSSSCQDCCSCQVTNPDTLLLQLTAQVSNFL